MRKALCIVLGRFPTEDFSVSAWLWASLACTRTKLTQLSKELVYFSVQPSSVLLEA